MSLAIKQATLHAAVVPHGWHRIQPARGGKASSHGQDCGAGNEIRPVVRSWQAAEAS
jgi:hypothetical protein